MRYVVMLVALLALGCSTMAAPTGAGVPDANLETLHDHLTQQVLAINGGTGFCVARKGNSAAVMTAAHVVRFDRDTGKPYAIITRYLAPDRDKVYISTVLAVYDPARDVAVFTVHDGKGLLQPLPIMGIKQYVALKAGAELFSTGHPAREVRPCLITVGVVKQTDYRMWSGRVVLYHTGSAWRGFSGGPVVHRETGYVIGVETNFTLNFVSNESLAAPAWVLQEARSKWTP